MPLSSQALYFHLGMNADDDGVVNNPKSIQRCIGASLDDLKILLAKRFVIAIEESGLIVIKHWKINNYIQRDRYTPTKYQKACSWAQTANRRKSTSLKTWWWNTSISKERRRNNRQAGRHGR